MSSDSINSLNTSDVTPSDQRSSNENGSSMKESDGDAMSKKSDSSSSDKQQVSESESDLKVLFPDSKVEKLFGSLAICFPHMHKENAPWLVDVDFTEDVQLRYTSDSKNPETVLQMDRERIQDFTDQDTVTEQFKALIEDIRIEKGLLVSMATIEEVGESSMGNQVAQATPPVPAPTVGQGKIDEAAMMRRLASLDDETLKSLYMGF